MKIVAIGEVYLYLKALINKLDEQQSTGPAPILYPKKNKNDEVEK